MRLGKFIESNLTEILEEWDSFAKAVFGGMDKANHHLLRDHAQEVLEELVLAMEKIEGPQKQIEKSLGAAPSANPDENAANVHGMLRHHDGISIGALAAEFRALRASVMRLWVPEIPVITKQIVIDIIRFNEAIDEALADSIATYENH